MADFKRPDIYLSEVLAAPQADVGVSLSNGCFVGAHTRGPIVPTLVTSFPQFVKLYGGFLSGVVADDLLYAVYQFFNNQGRQCYVVRVTDGNETISTVALLDSEVSAQTTLTVTAANPGVWGNSIRVAVVPSLIDTTRFALYVYYGGVSAANVVERFADLTMDVTDPRYVGAIVNAVSTSPTSTDSGSAYIRVTDAGAMAARSVSATAAAPVGTGTGSGASFVAVPVVLTGGGDPTGAPSSTRYDAALAQVDAIDSPLTMNLPGITSSTLINKALDYANGRGDVFVVVDGLTASTVAQQLTTAATYTTSNLSVGAVYFPRPRIADPASNAVGATKIVPPGGAVVGLFMANDAASGVQKTPAGLSSRIANAVGLEIPLANSDLDTLNQSNINAIRSLPGAGIVVFGGRTLTKTGRADKYISVRRSLILLKAEMKRLTQFALFEPNNPLLWQQVSNVLDQYLMGVWTSRGLAGDSAAEAFYVTCDDSNNTTQTVSAGELHVDVGVALQKPAEFVAIQVSQYDGVVTIAEAA